jgi:hypothetical protein
MRKKWTVVQFLSRGKGMQLHFYEMIMEGFGFNPYPANVENMVSS